MEEEKPLPEHKRKPEKYLKTRVKEARGSDKAKVSEEPQNKNQESP